MKYKIQAFLLSFTVTGIGIFFAASLAAVDVSLRDMSGYMGGTMYGIAGTAEGFVSLARSTAEIIRGAVNFLLLVF